MKKTIKLLLVSLSIITLSGCYMTKFEKPVAALGPTEIQQHFFVFGLVGEYTVDLNKECPRGVASFGDRFTVWDVLLTIASVGIYSPRTTFVRCAI